MILLFLLFILFSRVLLLMDVIDCLRFILSVILILNLSFRDVFFSIFLLRFFFVLKNQHRILLKHGLLDLVLCEIGYLQIIFMLIFFIFIMFYHLFSVAFLFMVYDSCVCLILVFLDLISSF